MTPLRHLSTKTAREAGIETRDVGKFLGHNRESTTEEYLRSLVPDLDGVSNALEEASLEKMGGQVGGQAENQG